MHKNLVNSKKSSNFARFFGVLRSMLNKAKQCYITAAQRSQRYTPKALNNYYLLTKLN
jgi:hypothetical protein